MRNEDSFRDRPALYRSYRPSYPAALYAWLASVCPAREAALDCATGNGQAATGLADRFERVAAFDVSAEQIAEAEPHPRVDYRVATAEALPYDDASFDLIAVAQGAHWFDLAAFYAEAARVARPGGVLALWGYSYCRVSPAIDAIVRERLLDRIEPYWAAGNRVIIDRYRSIEFPFEELSAPRFTMAPVWNREHFAGYLHTWSAVKRYVAERGEDPVAPLLEALEPVWPARAERAVEFDLPMRVGIAAPFG